jgi:type 1 glutamine amidotransferase
MPTGDLIVQEMSMSTIATDQLRGLRAGVEAGAGMVEVLAKLNVRTSTERGLRWAARHK